MVVGPDAPELAAQTLALGVSGWVARSSTPRELREAVRAAAQGRRYLTRRVAGGRVDQLPCGDEEVLPGVPSVGHRSDLQVIGGCLEHQRALRGPPSIDGRRPHSRLPGDRLDGQPLIADLQQQLHEGISLMSCFLGAKAQTKDIGQFLEQRLGISKLFIRRAVRASLIDSAHKIEQIAQSPGCIEIIIHRVLKSLAGLFYLVGKRFHPFSRNTGCFRESWFQT